MVSSRDSRVAFAEFSDATDRSRHLLEGLGFDTPGHSADLDRLSRVA